MADTNLSARVWPEDTGTGAADGNEDWDSAGYIGGMAAKDNASDYVEAGLGITPNYTTPAFDLAPGLAYIKYTGSVSIQLPTDDAATYSGSWDQGVTFAVDVDQQTGIALTDSAVNRVYLATDLTTNDGAYVRVDTEASSNVPADPYIKIAEIDTTNDTTTELNREPSATFSDVSVTGQVDASSASVGQVGIAPQEDRPLWSTGDKTVTVDASGGGDFTSIQEAIDNELAVIQRHKLKIDVAAGDYSTEDVYVPPTLVSRVPYGSTTEWRSLEIVGDRTTPSNVDVGSFFLDSVTGAHAIVGGFRLNKANPYSDEDALTELYGCSGYNSIVDMAVEPSVSESVGLMAYGGSCVTVANYDFGDGNLNIGVATKHQGQVWVSENGLSGSLNSHIGKATPGLIYVSDNALPSAASAGSTRWDTDHGGIINAGSTSGTRSLATSRMGQQQDISDDNTARVRDGGWQVLNGGGSPVELQTIQGGEPGQILILSADADEITVVDNSNTGGDDIYLGGSNVVLDDIVDNLVLMKQHNDVWMRVAYNDNR